MPSSSHSQTTRSDCDLPRWCTVSTPASLIGVTPAQGRAAPRAAERVSGGVRGPLLVRFDHVAPGAVVEEPPASDRPWPEEADVVVAQPRQDDLDPARLH